MSNFRELVKEFGRAAGLPALQLDEDGLCRIVIDGSTTIDFELGAQGDALLVTGHVIPEVEEMDDAIFSMCMELNSDIATHNGSFLAFNGNDDEIILLRRLDNAAMRYGDFEAMLNAFAGYLDQCRNTLMSGLGDADDDDEDDVDDGGEPAAPQENGMEMVFRL